MNINQNLVKTNVLNSLLVGAIFLFYYNRCGNSFDFCLPLIEFFVIFGLIALISGYLVANFAVNKRKKLINGTLSTILAPFVVMLIAILLLGKETDISDLFFQLYAVPVAFVGSLINIMITSFRK